VLNGGLLEDVDSKRVLQHLADLWSYDVLLQEVDRSGSVLRDHLVHPRPSAIAA
jgi:stage V sporulation protein R